MGILCHNIRIRFGKPIRKFHDSCPCHNLKMARCFQWDVHILKKTPAKTNMEREDTSLEKENNICQLDQFWVSSRYWEDHPTGCKWIVINHHLSAMNQTAIWKENNPMLRAQKRITLINHLQVLGCDPPSRCN